MAPECLVPVDLNASAAYECYQVVSQCIFENTLLLLFASILLRITLTKPERTTSQPLNIKMVCLQSSHSPITFPNPQET